MAEAYRLSGGSTLVIGLESVSGNALVVHLSSSGSFSGLAGRKGVENVWGESLKLRVVGRI